MSMTIDKKILCKISEISRNTADPERAEKNLLRFCEVSPDIKRLDSCMVIAARLFSISQFLANFCIANPEEFYSAVKKRGENITTRLLKERAMKELVMGENNDIDKMMKLLRYFKRRYLLRITLRDINGETDMTSSMDELTALAEELIATALKWSLKVNIQRFGRPPETSITLIGLGKLGGEELNYSSDVDLISVYENDEGETSGVPNPSGILFNKISNHEFYCKVIELLNKLLSAQTEDGIVYRVDLRLRPQGQKGEIALPLKAYQTYYESWGRTWERMALVRARPVAGDNDLGEKFIKVIEPFVWRTTSDYSEIEEIRSLKKKIDSAYTNDDIKRGYGGIREAEFFVQTFQMLYGGGYSSLKSYRILNAIQALKWMKTVPANDLTILWENYLYLRRIEHFLQIKDDLQIHTLPSSTEEIEVLAKLMRAASKKDFLTDLRLRRMQIKNMYNSLLGTQEDIHAEALNLLEGELNDRELREYLLFRKVRNPDNCLVNMKGIRAHMDEFRTMQERATTRLIIPLLLENALNAESPDRSLAGLEKIFSTYGLKTAHMNALKEQVELMNGIIRILSLSPYLTRIFLGNQFYLDTLIEEWSILKSLKEISDRLERAIGRSDNFESVLAEFRRFEEIRLGILTLLNILTIDDLFRGLSHLAEAMIRTTIERFESKGLSVIALGKLGGREMTFGSDLDIVFVSETPEARTSAEKILRTLTAYTDMGLLYNVDTRLRPDGSRGILVKDISGYRNYYLENAQNWEIQALLKARPVAGDSRLAQSFMEMAEDMILRRGPDIEKSEINSMRKRIIKELSHESRGIDIKLGPGGIEEIEFLIQFLQLHHAQSQPGILIQNSLLAIDRLAEKKILTVSDRDLLYNSYEYYRKLETFLRLNEEAVITEGSEVTELSAKFMGHSTEKEFLEYLKNLGKRVLSIADAF